MIIISEIQLQGITSALKYSFHELTILIGLNIYLMACMLTLYTTQNLPDRSL